VEPLEYETELEDVEPELYEVTYYYYYQEPEILEPSDIIDYSAIEGLVYTDEVIESSEEEESLPDEIVIETTDYVETEDQIVELENVDYEVSEELIYTDLSNYESVETLDSTTEDLVDNADQ
jgi:hypothetical protein